MHCPRVLPLLVWMTAVVAVAEETTEVDDGWARMRRLVQEMKVRSLDDDQDLPSRLESEPLLRFGDATRETADGGLWKLGSGRPLAIVALESTRIDGRSFIAYEFLCLTERSFQLTTGRGWNWRPAEPAFTFRPLPATSLSRADPPTNRLRLLKQLARRFSATETYEGEKYVLRMMARPIDHYAVDPSGDREGAVFVFANGTNPEVLLLVEADQTGWRYGLARLCGAAPSVTLDGEVVWTKPPMNEVGKSWRLDYTGDAHQVE